MSSQVQKYFFVDDAEDVKYVTVNFCVDNEAKISEVTIIKNKTTYNNENNIELLRQYLLGIQYYPDSKLRNNCYDSTFEFINKNYRNQNLNKSECKACEKFKTGVYKYKHVLYGDVKIKRSKKIQKEISKNEKQIYKIKWITNCHYVLIYKKMTEQSLKHLIGKEIDIQIIDVLEDGSYVYKSKTNFEEKINYGIIKKVE